MISSKSIKKYICKYLVCVFTSSSLLENTFSLTDSSILVALQFYSQLQITEKLITVLQMNRPSFHTNLNTQSWITDALSSDLDSDAGRTEGQQLYNTACNFVQPQQKQQQGKHQKSKAM